MFSYGRTHARTLNSSYSFIILARQFVQLGRFWSEFVEGLPAQRVRVGDEAPPSCSPLPVQHLQVRFHRPAASLSLINTTLLVVARNGVIGSECHGKCCSVVVVAVVVVVFLSGLIAT